MQCKFGFRGAIFVTRGPPKEKKTVSLKKAIAELEEQAQKNEPPSPETEKEERPKATQDVILDAKLDQTKKKYEII